MTIFNQSVNTVEGVEVFFQHLVSKNSLNFHPDSDFEEYVKPDGSQLFSQQECDHYNRLMNHAFEICDKEGYDIYDIGIEILSSGLF